jgi:hypothetical protein
MFHYIYDLAWMEFSDDEILIVKKINIKTTSSQEPSTIKNQQSTINNQQSTITITLRLPRPELS